MACFLQAQNCRVGLEHVEPLRRGGGHVLPGWPLPAAPVIPYVHRQTPVLRRHHLLVPPAAHHPERQQVPR